ncbi:MAG: hypothetical protein ACM3ML_14425 [Micromonosporaceae bacterium]
MGGLQEGSRWLRDQRQQTYVEYLDLLVALIRTFGVGMRVSKFGGQTAINSGHDFKGVDEAFNNLMDDLHHLEQRLELIVGDNVWSAKQKVDDLILSILDARDDEDIIEYEWDEIQEEGWDLLSELQKAMRAELGVKSTAAKRREIGRIVVAARPQSHESAD